MKSTNRLAKSFVGGGLVLLLALTVVSHAGAQVDVTLISNDPRLTWPTCITTDGVNLYVGVGSSRQFGSSQVLSLPIRGGSVTTLYSYEGPIDSIVVVGQDLFWLDGWANFGFGKILRAPKNGTGPITTIYGPLLGGPPFIPSNGGGITSDGTHLYIANAAGEVWRLNLDGSEPMEILPRRFNPTPLFPPHLRPNSIAERGGHLFLADPGNMDPFSEPILPQILAVSKDGGTSITLWSGDPSMAVLQGIAMRGDFIFVGNGPFIEALPASGEQNLGRVASLPQGSDFVTDLTLLNNALYVTATTPAFNQGFIYHVDLSAAPPLIGPPPPPPPPPSQVQKEFSPVDDSYVQFRYPVGGGNSFPLNGWDLTVGTVGRSPGVIPHASRTWLKFDLTQVPRDAVVKEARLIFTVSFGPISERSIGTFPGRLHIGSDIVDNWEEETLIWDNQPARSIDASFANSQPFQVDPSPDPVEISLDLSILQEEISQGNRYLTIVLRGDGDNGREEPTPFVVTQNFNFLSRETGGPFGKQPRLVIRYETPPPVTDVTAQVSITRGGFRYNRTTGRFVQQVTLKNISSNPIQGPVSLVLDNLSSNAELFNRTGYTRSGSPYINVNVGSDNVFSPGESAFVILDFKNPSNRGITYTTRVLAGPGER